MKKKTLSLSFVLSTFFCCSFLSAQDLYFSNTAVSTVLPRGTHVLQMSYERKNGGNMYFNGNYGRVAYQKSINPCVSIGASLSVFSESFVSNEVNAYDQKTRQYNAFVTDKKDYSLSINAKVRLADAEVDPIGLAVSNELTVGSNYHIFTPKLIIDKAFGNNYLALNASASFCNIKNETEIINASANNAYAATSFKNTMEPTYSAVNLMPNYAFNLGYLHFLDGSNFAYGCEVRTNSQSLQGVGLAYVALFAGPTLVYKSNKLFANVSVLPQIKNLHKTWIAPDNLVLDAHQQIEIKVSFGFTF